MVLFSWKRPVFTQPATVISLPMRALPTARTILMSMRLPHAVE